MKIKSKQRIKVEFPDTYVIVIALIILICILTYIIPAGKYDINEDKTINPSSFTFVKSKPASIYDFFDCFFTGMQKGSDTIFLMFLIGGAFQVLIDTGSVDALLYLAVKKSKGSYKIIVLVVAGTMGLLGALGVGNNVALAFTPIIITLCAKFGLDAIVVVALMYFASNAGFAASPVNPFTVLLAQNIAGIAPMSGIVPRCVMWCIFMGLTILFICRYCKKILKTPTKSFVGVYEKEKNKEEFVPEIKTRHIINMLILILLFLVYSYGGIRYNWGISKLGTAMVVLTFTSGIVGKMRPNEVARSFASGAKKMTYSSLLVGLASAISVIMTNSNIIYSIIYYMTIPLVFLPRIISAVGMFFVNFVFSFFVTSGSGQCFIVMPIIAPCADILGITRQIAVSAFQFGDGLCNAIAPTSGLLLGTLGIARVPYEKWLKFSLPATMILFFVASLFLVIMTIFGWH